MTSPVTLKAAGQICRMIERAHGVAIGPTSPVRIEIATFVSAREQEAWHNGFDEAQAAPLDEAPLAEALVRARRGEVEDAMIWLGRSGAPFDELAEALGRALTRGSR